MSPTCLIIIIIFSSGLIGGLANHLKSDKKDLIKNLVISVIAAATVPLFLSLVSSELMNKIYNPKPNEAHEVNCLIFLGYCLICSFSADNFMSMISTRIINEKLKEENKAAVKETVEAKKQAAEYKREGVGILNATDPEKINHLKSKIAEESIFKSQLKGVDKNEILENSDPDKGKWGGKSTSKNRTITAIVKESSIISGFFNIHLEVRSTDKNILTGEVIFHIHPTFPNPERIMYAKNGVAQLDLLSYGSFTVGVECDNRTTQLELDLAELADVPNLFRER